MSKNQQMLSTSTWKKIRLRVLARDSYTCHYCSEPANEVDHIVPLAVDKSEAYNMDNLVAACRRCNNLKGTKEQSVFLARSSTPPAFIGIISPKGETSTTVFSDFGCLND